ncbi:thiolase family protein [Actinacidiphila reveromycinica]|uniref:thiolase family protein n=1 Tax=Actinacidiphila reveromycinica TaxID=659352 RepID=UPI001923D2C1|nr:thiolase family protein [Streptomyces sp. SN-593]
MALPGIRPVFVAGGGLHAYQRASGTPYVQLGLTAVRRALEDAGLAWPSVESAYVGSAQVGMAAGPVMLRHLGATGLRVVQVENASASGSSAFRQAVVEVAGGFADVVLAVGVDTPDPRPGGPSKSAVRDLVGRLGTPAAHLALAAEHHLRQTPATPRQLALVAVKNHANAAANPYAQRRRRRTLEEVLASGTVAGCLTRLQCAPRGEGAAAVLVVSEEAIGRYGLDRGGCVRVLASASRTVAGRTGPGAEVRVTADTAAEAYAQAGVGPRDLDVLELHDAFSVEELVYLEAMGVCAPGEAGALLERGRFDIGGERAVSPSGGLLGMGHPLGPTGVGQVVEVRRQLLGRAGARQHPGARTALAHMVGVGGVCLVHVLGR